jgi:hypothetical protein
VNASTEDFVSVLISRGTLPTGGFLIHVEGWSWLESYPVVFSFEVDLTDPGEGVMVTEALTNPIALIPVGPLDPGLYVARAHIDRFIMTYDDEGTPVFHHVETLVEEVWETGFEVSTVPTGSVGLLIRFMIMVRFTGSNTMMKTPTTRRVIPNTTMRSASSTVSRAC